MIALRHQTGGVELIGIDKSGRTRITVKEKASPQAAVGSIEVEDAVPPEVVTFRIRRIPRGMTAADMTMKVDAALRTRVLDGIPDKLTRFYVFPDLARRMNDALAEHRKKGDYDAISDADDLAQTLTEHLRAVSHDLHLFVRYVPRVLPPDDPDPIADRPPRGRSAAPSWSA